MTELKPFLSDNAAPVYPAIWEAMRAADAAEELVQIVDYSHFLLQWPIRRLGLFLTAETQRICFHVLIF